MYVNRDGNGDIAALARWPQDGWSGETLADDDPEILAHEGLDLTSVRAAALAAVDVAAEAARGQWITPGAGMALVYERKRAEAEAMEADGSPDGADCPVLAAEVGITAGTLAEVGAAVRAKAAAWTGVAALIETARLQAKAAIAAAADDAAIQAVLDGLAWPAPE